MSGAVWVVAAWYGGWSVVTAAAYLRDKRAAIRGDRRTPERTLHRLGWWGGWPGALWAMEAFRHKRRKAAFKRRVYLTATTHLLVWGLIGYGAWRRGAFG